MSTKSPNVSPNVVVEGSDIQPIEAVEGLEFSGDSKTRRADLVHSLGNLGANNLVILPESGMPLSAGVHATLKTVENLDKGRRRSQHGVQFGQLAIEGGDHTKTTELVGVKYLPLRKAVHELMAGKLIDERLGRAATFQTLGFVKPEASNKVGIITRYDHSVVSLDNTLYDAASSANSRLAAVDIAAKYLAQLHGASLVHGDAQPKNIAANSQKDPHFVDLESVRNVLRNVNGDKVGRPELNKLMDIGDFFGTPYGSHDWHPTFPEVDRFIGSYSDAQSGSYKLSGDHIIELLIDKIDDF